MKKRQPYVLNGRFCVNRSLFTIRRLSCDSLTWRQQISQSLWTLFRYRGNNQWHVTVKWGCGSVVVNSQAKRYGRCIPSFIHNRKNWTRFFFEPGLYRSVKFYEHWQQTTVYRPFVCDIQHKKLIQVVFYLDYVPFPLGDKGSCEKEGYEGFVF